MTLSVEVNRKSFIKGEFELILGDHIWWVGVGGEGEIPGSGRNRGKGFEVFVAKTTRR